MISLLLSEPEPRIAPTPPEPPPVQPTPEDTDFEIVVGRRQMASIGLVVVVLLAVFSGVSYLVGKSAVPKVAVPAPAPEVPQIPIAPAAEPPAPGPPLPLPIRGQQTPLFASPVRGAVYIQVGAVEMGVAQIWVEGLRTHGLDAFVAAGPSERIFRVLVGPLPTPEAYQRAESVLGRIGLAMFGRKYQE